MKWGEKQITFKTTTRENKGRGRVKKWSPESETRKNGRLNKKPLTAPNSLRTKENLLKK